jgi:putative aldouronate transport system permease protein
MLGLIISFMDYNIINEKMSTWVGLKHFIDILTLPEFNTAIINTINISFLNLLICFPAPIIFALLLNEMKNNFFKKLVQTVSYMPFFLSWIAVIGMVYSLYATYGMVNDLRVLFGGENVERIMFLAQQNLFVFNIIILSLWKSFGWSSIIYLAAITGIDPQLYEAATIDGAGKFRQCLNVTLPSILPTIVIMLILAIGNIFKDNFDLIYGLQNPFIKYEIISTVIYKQGISAGNYSVSTAFGFMQGLVGLILTLGANWLSKKVNNVALW